MQPQISSSTAAGISSLQAAPAAESSSAAAVGMMPATSTARDGLLSSPVEPSTQQQLQPPQSPSGLNSAANMASISAASSGSISSLIWPPSMSGSGQRPVPLQQKQQQQLLPVAAVAPGSGPSVVGSAASKGSHTSHIWPVIVGTASEVQPVQALTQLSDVDGTVSSWDGDLGGSRGPSARVGDREGPSSPLCETWLVTELCDRGTLARQVGEWQPHLYEHDMLRLLHLLRDVAFGLKLLKLQNIVHADLNAHNVLVASSSVAPHGLVAKVADLGLSRVLKQQTTHRTTGTVGMLTHQPPELLQDGRMSPAVDIYSFGIMMYEVYTRQAAYGRLRYGQIYHKVVVQSARPPVPEDMPEDYVLLMKRCWSGDSTDRPSIDMVLECLNLMIEARREQPLSYPTDRWQHAGDAVV